MVDLRDPAFMQKALAVMLPLLLLFGGAAYVLDVGGSWLTLAVLAGMGLVALAIWLLRPHRDWQLLLVCALIAGPPALSAWQQGNRASLAFLAGSFVPVLAACIAVLLAAHAGRRHQYGERDSFHSMAHHGGDRNSGRGG